ncbi:MAG: hypothetical protein ACLR6I_16920 [Waltera sp.]
MREIALEMARKKYTSKKAYEKANRKAQLEVIHNWYQRNVKRYGFEYNFYPSGGCLNERIEFRRKFKPADTGKLGLGVGTSAERTGGNGKRTKTRSETDGKKDEV